MVVATEHIGLVRHLVNSMVRSNHYLYEEAYQEGMLGLVVATTKYDPTRGVPFSAYARYWIRAYVLICLRKHKYSGYSPVEIVSNLPSPEEVYLRNEQLGILLPAVDRLVAEADSRQLYILDRRLLSDEPKTLQSIALEWGVSKQRVSEIELKLVDKLRKEVLQC